MQKGDLVSVVDDDLKGVVIAVRGNLIEIEDEHGFVYQFQKNQLVLQNHNIYQEIAVEPKKEISKKTSKKHQQAEFQLDLHFEKLVQNPKDYESWERIFIQKEKLIEAVEYCKANFIKKLVVVHGIGDGVLQDIVYETLRGISDIEFDDNPYFKNSIGNIEVRIL